VTGAGTPASETGTPPWPAARLLGPAALLLCLALRVAALDRLPIFIDEAIHLRQAEDAWSGAWLHPGIARYLPTWINALVAIHMADPLRALRMSSAVWGTLTAAGLIALGRSFAQPGAGLLAAFLYAVVPYGVVHDRMGLVDPLFTALVMWSTVVASWWRRRPSPLRGTALGLLVGGMLLTKPYGALALAVPGVFAPPAASGKRAWPAVAGVFVVAALAATPLWIDLGVVIPILAEGQGESAAAAVSQSTSRLAAAAQWHLTYLTPTGAALAALALVRRAFGGRTPWPVLASWILWGPALALSLAFAAGFAQFPRHLQPSVPLLLYVMASEGTALLQSGRGRAAFVAATGLLCAQSLALDYRVVADPRTARIAAEDHWQYVTGWPSGYGLPEVAARLRAESLSRSVLVVRDSRWVPLSLGLDVSLRGLDIARVEISGEPGAWADELPRVLASGRSVYLAREVEREAATIPVLDLTAVKVVPAAFQLEKPEARLVLDLFAVTGPAADGAPASLDLGPLPLEMPEATAQARRGVSAALAGEHAEAATWLWRAHRLEPGNLTIRYDLGVVLAALRRKPSSPA
jgi:dolichyl-phosphate-mannose-protein mannosyltransferase